MAIDLNLNVFTPVSAENQVFLNYGVSGKCSSEVVSAIYQRLILESNYGGGNPYIQRLRQETRRLARAKFAEVINASESEIMLTSSTTEGVNVISNGVKFQPGDEVIITNHEHYSCLVTWKNLQVTKGIHIKTIDLSTLLVEDGKLNLELFLEKLTSLISHRTKLFFCSHILYTTGTEMPIERICEFLRSKNVLSLIDGAQSFAHIEVDVKKLGCDFYAVSGAKWLCGPPGTAALYIKVDKQSELEHTYCGYVSVTSSETLEFEINAFSFEVSTINIPLLCGTIRAIDEYLIQGKEKLERIRRNASAIYQFLAAYDHINFYSSYSSNGIITFKSTKIAYEELFKEFLGKGIVCRDISELEAVRLTVPDVLESEDFYKIRKVVQNIFS
ncbi:hypothetical protein Elgi_52310 [Paenibacillus elgii]|uniref:aminotransferase class V-fold PLP-dependent enzyme n=1 Tax=Paenibacillus elgii TaxID=189691 RepID=UPI002D7AEFCC|nr:hypothetical protein Elgi_52310 [Paenibacillus elgii]